MIPIRKVKCLLITGVQNAGWLANDTRVIKTRELSTTEASITLDDVTLTDPLIR
jgi:hypothetical protein